MTENEYIKLHVLLEHVLEGNASVQEYVGLQKIISQNESLQKYYFRYVELQAGLHQLKRLDSVSPLTPEHLSGFLSVLGEQEEEAERVELKMTPPAPTRLIQKVVHEKTVRKINKASLITAIVSMAAVIFLVVFANFAPVRTGSEVASLSDCIHAKWADSDIPMEQGARLRTGDAPILLREGFAEILFDNNARLTIEAPAEFKILTDDQIKLNYGRLYAVVPHEAMGFTVSTHSSKIIDLGTEFGVHGDLNGNVELHVTKGKTLLTAIGTGESVFDVIAGQARKVIVGSSRVEAIPIQNNVFVRKIDSKSQFVWKGQKRLSLTDLLLGGDGYNTSTVPEIEYNPLNGLQGNLRALQYEPGTGGYVKVSDNSCVDGIFIPDGKTNPVIVSSSGLPFESCPATTGLFYSNINILRSWKFYEPAQGVYEKYRKDASHPSVIYLHSNIGITFDLQKVRQASSGLRLRRFNTFVGTIQTLNNNVMGTQDFSEYDVWVLVDGQIRFSAIKLRFDGSREISIELKESDRFLSLAVTDGQVVYFKEKPANHFDTCGFADPVFEVELK
jgi:hypothetical protein